MPHEQRLVELIQHYIIWLEPDTLLVSRFTGWA